VKHRISSGGIVVFENRILLVRHFVEDKYDFWVAPGGGLKPKESIFEGAVREVKEETGLVVETVKPVYFEQFYQPERQHIKTWILCRYISGEISTSAPEATREYIVEASWLDENQIKSMAMRVFPEVLINNFWKDLQDGFPELKYLGNRQMEFY
jgi:8-oxo-dGTP diphosphatase